MRPLPDAASRPSAGEPPGGVGEETAFDRLFGTYYNPLRRYVYRYLRSWEEAEDVVHDVFLRLWVRRTESASIGDLDAYLYTAARNRALTRLTHLAHESRWRTAESARQRERPGSARGPEQELARREIAAAIQRALDALSSRQREVILLHWRGRTYDEIGAALGISPKTVSAHVSRAFDALREILTPLLG